MPDFILTASVSWPGSLSVRGESTRRGRGYPTREAAQRRLSQVQRHYNAKFGTGTNHRIRERA